MSASGGQDQLLLGDLLVEGELGSGGMGTVYRVRSQRTGERFAMKVTRFHDWERQRLFLLELMTWYGLPAHPHLVPCRFFRTLKNQIAIFAEVVDGGSLANWIHQGKLTQLEQILDVAIQFAWGLHVAHELGVVHQDVKPGNVLLTSAGLVKVADFGLARARAVSAPPAGGGSQHSVAVTAGLMTREYCSLEQYDGRPLTRKTDIWSWAVSMLEMFLGERRWDFGKQAPAELEKYLQRGPRNRGLPAMPLPVADILRKCFRPDPAERWATMAEACDALITAYRAEVGRDYSRALPPVPARDAPAAQPHDRSLQGAQWHDPKEWLTRALAAAGRDQAEVHSLLVARPSSRRAHVIADLIGYEEAVRIFQDLVKAGGQEQTAQLAALCASKSLVHLSVDDSPGALTLFDQSIALYELLVHQEGRWDLANDLARTYQNKAIALQRLGELRAALALCDQANALFERLVYQEGRWDLADSLAMTYQHKANALQQLGELRAAVTLYDQAIALFERLVHQEGRWDLASYLAMTFENKALALADQGELWAAVALHDQAVALYERLVHREGRWDLANDLAATYQNKALALADQGELWAAVALYDQAIAFRERLVHQEGRWDLANDLAATYQNKAAALAYLGELRAALALQDQAIALSERLVRQEGRWDLANDLAMSYQNKANALQQLGELQAAVALCDQAIALYERLVHQEGRWDLANDLATTYQKKAIALAGLGELRAAVALYDQAIAFSERLVSEGRQELRGNLAKTKAGCAWALLGLGELDRARREAREAVAILQAEVERTQRADLKAVLEWATEALREVL